MFLFYFSLFFYWIAQQASSLCVWLIPLAHTPSPSAAAHWKGEGTAIDHFFPHTCTHTPYLPRHYRSTCLMFFCGEKVAFPLVSFYIYFLTFYQNLRTTRGDMWRRRRKNLNVIISFLSQTDQVVIFFHLIISEIWFQLCYPKRRFKKLASIKYAA